MPAIRPRIGGAFNCSALKIRSITADLDASARRGGNGDEVSRVAGEASNSPVEAKLSSKSPEAKSAGDAKTGSPEVKTAGETEAEAAAGRLSGCKCESPCTPRSDGKSWC